MPTQATMPEPSARTKRRAVKARDKIYRIRAEIHAWKGVAPKLVRVNLADLLALTEVGWIDKAGKLSGTDITIKEG